MTINDSKVDFVGWDFTMDTYRRIAQLASGFVPASYSEIPWDENFILFRHDVDVSLNRALALANIDSQLGLRSTFFIDPLNNFYSAFDPDQRKILFEILDLGHFIGLHFDSSRHAIKTEESLEEALRFESKVLSKAVAEPLAFSFHNPSKADLAFKKDSYAGIPNAYSEKLFTRASYTSDSNGYWRHTPIVEVLSQSLGLKPVQVLTHPEWWLDETKSPRSRIYRALYGRARAVISSYDSSLAGHGRLNLTGMPPSFQSLALSNDSRSQTLDTLWNMDRLDIIFIELWRLRECQISNLCKVQFRKFWGLPPQEVNAFFDSAALRIDGRRLLELVFEVKWANEFGSSNIEHVNWTQLVHHLVQARGSIGRSEINSGLVHVSDSISKLAEWGLAGEIKYDGLAPLDSIGVPTCKAADGSILDRLLEDNEGESTTVPFSSLGRLEGLIKVIESAS
jgi:hypothetical protein